MNSETLTTKEQQYLWDIMHQINNGWLTGQPAQLADYFHENIVFNSPDLRKQSIGKDICIQSYTDFISNSKILFFDQTNPIVHVFDNTAIVTYDFEMKYEQKDQVYDETGTDIMIFNKQRYSWKAVWRTLLNLKSL
jgi:hypothetical protein